MNTLMKAMTYAIVGGALVTTGTAPVLAHPAAGLPLVLAGFSQNQAVELAQYRNGRRHGGYGRGRGNGPGIALGIGAAIIGGIILSEAARADHRNVHGDDWDRCARTYRSFEPETGMYTLNDGRRRTCPFLR